jgi:hypothetical protein
MLYSIGRAAGYIALLCPTVLSAVLPSDHLVPEVPWKRNGLPLRRTEDGYNTGSKHGPNSRGAWDGEYDISTDYDLKWPTTGKTVKVTLFASFGCHIPC